MGVGQGSGGSGGGCEGGQAGGLLMQRSGCSGRLDGVLGSATVLSLGQEVWLLRQDGVTLTAHPAGDTASIPATLPVQMKKYLIRRVMKNHPQLLN